MAGQNAGRFDSLRTNLYLTTDGFNGNPLHLHPDQERKDAAGITQFHWKSHPLGPGCQKTMLYQSRDL